MRDNGEHVQKQEQANLLLDVHDFNLGLGGAHFPFFVWRDLVLFELGKLYVYNFKAENSQAIYKVFSKSQ